MLEECVCDHCHQRVTMKAVPRPSLEVVEPEFLLQLLMSLFADPSCLDRRSQAAQVHLGGQVGKIIFLLPGGAVLADEPGFVPRKMLLAHVLDPLRRSISGPHANRGEASFQPALGPVSPTHILPLGIGQHVFGRRRQYIGNVPLAGTTSTGDRQINLTSTG